MKQIFLLVLSTQLVMSGIAQDAEAYVQSALTNYGPWENVKTFSYQLKGKRNAGAQAKSFNSGEKQEYYNTKVFDYTNKLAFEQNTNTFPGGYIFNFANVAKDTTIYNWDIGQNRSGKVLNKGGAAQSKQIYNLRDIQNAYYRVNELKESKDSIVLLPGNSDSTKIERYRKGKNPLVYTFDKDKRLVSVESVVAKELQTFSDYTNENGYVNAATIKLFNNGTLTSEEKISNWQYNFTPSPKQFSLPVGYVETTRGTPSVSEIAKDIYLIDKIGGDRNVMFVNMDDHIVVIEAPLSSTVSADVINKIKEKIPGKPIKHVFTTHFHSDHSGGLRQYVAEGASLVMAEKTRPYINTLMEAKVQDDLSKSQRSAQFETFNGKFELKDANHHIIFYEVPNSHADGLSLVYFPKEKIIYQGDLLSVPLDGSIPYAIEVHKEMNDFLKANKLSFTKMVGHHGHNNITPALFSDVLKTKKVVKY